MEDYPLPDELKMPSYVGSYNGKGDPDNYLHLFKGAIRMQKWAMPVPCHMFTYTLEDSARIWERSSAKKHILKDFSIEVPSEEDEKIMARKMETKKENLKLDNTWKLYTDGALSFDGSGLRIAQELEIRSLADFADSQLMVNHIKGLFEARQLAIKQYLEKDFSIEVPSEEDEKIMARKMETKKENLKLDNTWKLYTDGALSFDGSGLRIAQELEIRSLADFADSQLMVNHIKGLFEARQLAIKQYLEKLVRSQQGWADDMAEYSRYIGPCQGIAKMKYRLL
nr:reverse transcriptase domain-containing protein [Tanacetum cinerariifolium]